MATSPELPSGAVPVVDQRTAPAGVLPRRLQTWIMAGLAAVILGIILLAGSPTPPVSTTTGPRPQAPSADRVRDYQDRLRAMEARAALDAAAERAEPLVMRAESPSAGSGGRPEDPAAADRRRRDYESLFASNVVVSRRGEGQRPVGGSQETAQPVQPATPEAAPPSLDAVAAAVLRATGRPSGAAALGQNGVPAASVSATGSSASAETPIETGPIAPVGPQHRILEGTFIDAVLTNRLDGSEAAPVVSLVTHPVYAHAGHVVVVPAGARVIGTTRPVRSVGETRLAVAFHRLVMPDGRTYRLDRTAAVNPRGDTGLRDQVDQHYWATFGAAGAVGLISGLAQWLGTAGVSGGESDQTVVIGGTVASTSAQTAAQVMSRFLNRLPTVTIREGHRLKVYLARDLELPAYEPATPLTSVGRERR